MWYTPFQGGRYTPYNSSHYPRSPGLGYNGLPGWNNPRSYQPPPPKPKPTGWAAGEDLYQPSQQQQVNYQPQFTGGSLGLPTDMQMPPPSQDWQNIGAFGMGVDFGGADWNPTEQDILSMMTGKIT